MTASPAAPPPFGATPEPLLDITFQADAASVPTARRAVRLGLAGRHDARLDTVLLLATELMSNAVANAEGKVRLHVADDGGPLRVEVTDSCGKVPKVRAVPPESLHGRGMLLIASLATAWGHFPVPGGKTVWFVVD